MKPIILTTSLKQQIEQEGAASFPNECCGIIYGVDEPHGRVVSRLEAVSNEFEAGERYHRFSITPADLIKAEKSAAAHNELIERVLSGVSNGFRMNHDHDLDVVGNLVRGHLDLFHVKISF